MKKNLLLVFSVMISITSLAQKDGAITIGTIDSVQSTILNENRKVWVYLPNGGQPGDFPKRYPVVYLLDGDAHFYSVVGMIQQLSQVNGNTICPEMIVVGIPNTNRTRDLTPTHIDADPPFMDSAFAKPSGGGPQFISFIEKELMPYIDSTYPTAPYKMLIGHSFGGLTVMDALVNHTGLFNAYICLDPSMWWDKTIFLKTVKKSLSKKNFSGTTLYLGIANTMDEGMDIKKVQTDTSLATRHIRSILDMDTYIKNNPPKGLKYASKYYENDDHGSLPLIAEYNALRFIFEKYRFNLPMEFFFNPMVNVAAAMEKHYAEEVSPIFGYKVSPPEDQVNSMGYQFMGMQQMNKAAQLFKMNVENYPASQNVWDSYGDYFLAITDKEKAIENFKKALSIKETPETRKKLDDLMK